MNQNVTSVGFRWGLGKKTKYINPIQTNSPISKVMTANVSDFRAAFRPSTGERSRIRPTLRKWVRRFQEQGIDGLRTGTKRPKSSPAAKLGDKQREWIPALRTGGLGSRRIQNELKRIHSFEVCRATIDKALRAMEAKPRPRGRKHCTRYAKLIPGERVQMDTCKIAPGVYQYTPIDDCARIRVLAIYSRRSAANSLLFLERAFKEFPFAIQRIQTDRGREFFAYLCFGSATADRSIPTAHPLTPSGASSRQKIISLSASNVSTLFEAEPIFETRSTINSAFTDR